jgi:6-phosphofructokinase 2
VDAITLTLNPTVDVSTEVVQVVAEEKLRCSPPVRDPGGGGLNVARVIAVLGGEAAAVFPVGGATGEMLRQLVAPLPRITAAAVPVTGWTREGFTVTETSTNHQFRFNVPGEPLTADERDRCVAAAVEALADDGYLVVSGSMPPDTPDDLLTGLAAAVRDRGGRLVVDTSGEALRTAVAAGPDLVKPNLGELAWLVGAQHLDLPAAAAAARSLVEGGCRHVLTSMGPSGALLVSRDTEPVHLVPPMVRVRSRVGAGDSTVAGMVLALARGRGVVDAAVRGVAAGTAAVMTPGTQLCRREDVEAVAAQVEVRPL